MELPRELDPQECWELLALTSLGRIALSVGAMPAILPVQFYLGDRALTVCLGQHRIPDVSVTDTVVAFAADSIESSSQSGWTVQVQGRARISLSDGTPLDCGQPAEGQIVHIEPANVVGHRFTLCPFVAGF